MAPPTSAKSALAGVDELLALVTDDEYRHSLQDLFTAFASMDGLTVFWGTTGCSLRVAIPNRSPLSVGWVFPPGPPRWMGLTDVTLGCYEDSNGLQLSPAGHAALAAFIEELDGLQDRCSPSLERFAVAHSVPVL